MDRHGTAWEKWHVLEFDYIIPENKYMDTINTIRVLDNFYELEHEWDGVVIVSERKRQDRS